MRMSRVVIIVIMQGLDPDMHAKKLAETRVSRGRNVVDSVEVSVDVFVFRQNRLAVLLMLGANVCVDERARPALRTTR
jgi:hypothetical protein